jgi:hypothetical protein
VAFVVVVQEWNIIDSLSTHEALRFRWRQIAKEGLCSNNTIIFHPFSPPFVVKDYELWGLVGENAENN